MGETTGDRRTLLTLLGEMQRCMQHRLEPETVEEWLRLELTLPQTKVLFWLLAAGEQPMSQLARTLGIGMPAATNLVDRLVEHAYATREHSPLDRRVVLVQATEKAARLVQHFREVHQAQFERIIRCIPDDQVAAIIEAVSVFIDAARRAEARGPGPAADGGASSGASSGHVRAPVSA